MADLFDITKKKSALEQIMKTGLDRNDYATLLAKQRGSRQMFDLNRGFKMQTPKVMSAYLRRGLGGPGVQTGVYERGLQDFAAQKEQQTFDLQSALNAEQDRLKSERADIQSQYQSQLADLEQQSAWQQAQAAALLTGLKPYIGG